MHWGVGVAVGLLFNVLESIVEIPAVTVCLVLIGLILGEDPLSLLSELSKPGIFWNLVRFALLFSLAFQWIEQPMSMACHLGMTVAWKWGLVGRMAPGRRLTASKWGLFNYAVLRRLVESPRWALLQDTFCASPVLGAVYRTLGATVGDQAFLGGLLVVEFDALTVADLCSAASNSRAYCTAIDGTVMATKLDQEATIGNGVAVFPGVRLGAHSVVGNDTAVAMERVVPPHGRVQGVMDYVVQRRDGGRDRAAEEALGLPSVVSMSASGVEKVDLPWW